MSAEPVKRKKYSKLGCTECKRRKIKCDETKPICWHCQRLEKGCQYLAPREKSRYKKSAKDNSRSKPNKIVRHLRTKPIVMRNDAPQAILDENDNRNNGIAITRDKLSSPSPKANTLSNLFDDNMIIIPETFQDSTSNLAQSLNDLLSSQINQTSILPDDLMSNLPLFPPLNTFSNNEFSSSNTDIDISPSSLASHGNLGPCKKALKMKTPIIPHIKISSFKLSPTHMEYLKLFAYDFVKIILPFCPTEIDNSIHQKLSSTQASGDSSLFSDNINSDIGVEMQTHKQTRKPSPLSTASLSFFSKLNELSEPKTSIVNPARDVILYYAQKESYVLAAVLACGALIAHRYRNSSVDEERYCGYLSTCMPLFGQSLNEATLSTNKKKKGEIEGMIITTLLLTSYNASSNVVKWRPHLETAGRLLMRSEFFSKDQTNIEKEVLAFCKSWFFSIEIIAGTSSNWGGTMNDKDWKVMETWIKEDSEILKTLKITWKNPKFVNDDDVFNLMFGYTNKLAIILGRLCCVLRHARLGVKLKLNEISWFLTQLESKEVREYSVLSNSGYLSKDFKLDPLLGVPDEAVEKFDDIALSGEVTYVSWWDICYQAQRMSGIIHTLTNLFMLDRHHFLVVNAIEETVDLLKVLRTKKKIKSFSLMMFQFCVFLVGKWTTQVQHRLLVTKFFRDLHDFGNIAALYTMKKLERMWRNEDGVSDDGVHEEEDIINY